MLHPKSFIRRTFGNCIPTIDLDMAKEKERAPLHRELGDVTYHNRMRRGRKVSAVGKGRLEKLNENI